MSGHFTETTRETAVLDALRAARADLEGRDYLPYPWQYECDLGTLYVRNAKATGGKLLGVFEADLLGPGGALLCTYPL